MAFTENVIDRTKRIEKQLKDLGAAGVGLHELVSSMSCLLDDQLRFRLRYIITVRNKVVHEHDYIFDDDEAEFIRKCDEVLEKLAMQKSQEPPPATQPRPALAPSKPSKAVRRPRRRPRFNAKQILRVFAVLLVLTAAAFTFQHRDKIEATTKAAWRSGLALFNNLTASKPKENKTPHGVPQFATVAEAQRAAVKKYPPLGVAGTDFNKKFLALYKKYQNEQPSLFRDNNWPVLIADEVAADHR